MGYLHDIVRGGSVISAISVVAVSEEQLADSLLSVG